MSLYCLCSQKMKKSHALLFFRQPCAHSTVSTAHITKPSISYFPDQAHEKRMPTMQQMQTTFNLHMEPIKTHEDYPKYARSETKPVVRARHIVDQGDISDHPCTACVELEQDCYRWEGTFSKCAYCTSKDKKREFCHLPGQEASSVPERRKRRKM